MTDPLPEVTAEEMQDLLTRSRPYVVCVLRPGPRYDDEGARDVIWAHGRRNLALRKAGKLVIILRVGTEIAGIGVFATSMEETEEIMAGDPAVRAGILESTLYTASGFPGDALPFQPQAE